jgi:transcriptional regulator GlxA family with amidase domain
LLDGRKCTTFPDLDLARGVSFVSDGKTLTSRVGVKNYDVPMCLVDHLCDEEVARGVGRGMVIDWPPKELIALVE